jgi:hypothetical protein
MRTVAAGLLAEQIKEIREPVAKAVIYDSILRFQMYQSIALVAYPSTEYAGTPVALIDASVVGSTAYIVASANNLTKHYHCPVDDWETPTVDYSQSTPIHRASVDGATVYYYVGDAISKNDSAFKVIGSGKKIALAGVSSTEVYTLELTTVGTTNALLLTYHTAASAAEMPNKILLPDDYTEYAITWFDAVRMSDGTDVIVVNVENQGLPMIITRRNGVWSDRRVMIPIDIVDNYSYVRIGWMKIYDGVIYATGELGRKGSTGRHPQSMGVVLRSSDGEHWTLDRYRYLGQTPQRGPLLISSGYAYNIKESTVERAPLTPVFGLNDNDVTADHVHITIYEDLLGFSKTDVGRLESGACKLAIGNPDSIYSDIESETYIKSGYMLYLYAGFKISGVPTYTQLNVYGIDNVSGVTGSAENSLMIDSREWALRCLKDAQFDQDWQWLSQTKHWDDCDKADGLYAITGGYIDIVTPDGTEKAIVDATTISDTNGLIQFQTKNKNSIAQSTTPFDALNGIVSVLFRPTASASFAIGGSFSLSNYGAGAGVAFILDENNAILAFYNVVDKTLAVISVVDGSSSLIDSSTLSSFGQTANDYFQIVCSRRDNGIRVVCNNYLSGGEGIQNTGTLDAEVEMITDAFGIVSSHGAYVLNPNPEMTYLSSGTVAYIDYSVWNGMSASFTGPVEIYNYEDYYYPLPALWNMPQLSTLANKTVVVNSTIQASSGGAPGDDRRSRAILTSYKYGTGAGYIDFSYDDYITIYDAIVNEFYDSSVKRKTCVMHCFLDQVYVETRAITSIYLYNDGLEGVLRIAYSGSLIHWESSDRFYLGPAIQLLGVPSATPSVKSLEVNSNGGIDIEEFSAFDTEHDKTMEWVLEDIASKAGIISFDTKYSIDEDFSGSSLWLDDEMASMFIDISMPGAITGSDVLQIYVGMSEKSTSVDPLIGVKIEISNDGADGLDCIIYHTNIGFEWVEMAAFNEPESETAKNFRVTKMGRYLSVWAENRLIASVALRSIFGLSTDGYSSYVESGGYVGIYTDVSGTKNIKQVELSQIIGASTSAGVVVDQRTPAATAFTKVIRDARIKILPAYDASIKISAFTERDDLGTAPDRIYTHSNSPSDRIPTCVRVVGEEISEMFDHDRIKEYGVVFHSINVETLGEDEAFAEARKTVNDAMSYSSGSQETQAVQLQWEIEDKVAIEFESYDGRVVDEDCVVDGIQTVFSPPALESQVSLRRLYEDS